MLPGSKSAQERGQLMAPLLPLLVVQKEPNPAALSASLSDAPFSVGLLPKQRREARVEERSNSNNIGSYPRTSPSHQFSGPRTDSVASKSKSAHVERLVPHLVLVLVLVGPLRGQILAPSFPLSALGGQSWSPSLTSCPRTFFLYINNAEPYNTFACHFRDN